MDSLSSAIRRNAPGTFSLRLRAMLVHMTLTTVVAAATYSLIRWLWYPGYFWQLAAGHSLFLLVCTVDAVLGPLLTFLVFNPAKGTRKLKGDLLAIALLQALALAYGLWSVSVARPLFLAYSVDRFDLVKATDVDSNDLGTAEVAEFRKLSWGRPQVIGTREPKDSDERFEFVDAALAGRDRHLMPKTYVPLSTVVATMKSRARPLSELKSVAADRAQLVVDAANRLASSHDDLGFVPVLAQGDWVMIIDRRSGELIEVLPIDGFKVPVEPPGPRS